MQSKAIIISRHIHEEIHEWLVDVGSISVGGITMDLDVPVIDAVLSKTGMLKWQNWATNSSEQP